MNERFPSRGEVLQACRGVDHAGHPMLRAAHALTSLHERRSVEQHIGDHLDARAAGLVREIDRWVRAQLPEAPDTAAVHPETVGAVVDRIARHTATAYAALVGPADDLDGVWGRLAEAAAEYEDLADELVAGNRRLPNMP
ncbi:DUF4254 domain-containing protein [Nocardia takedensis]